MDTKRCLGCVLALLPAVTQSLDGANEFAIVKEAACLLEQIATDPESGMPVQSLREAAGILIIPHIVDTRLGMGRKRGHSVFLSQDDHGEWGHPEPRKRLTGHSVTQASTRHTDKSHAPTGRGNRKEECAG